MSRHIPDSLRILVAVRANFSCEYCRLPAQDSLFVFHIQADEMGELLPRTIIGEATIKMLNLNHPDSIIERRELVRLGLFNGSINP